MFETLVLLILAGVALWLRNGTADLRDHVLALAERLRRAEAELAILKRRDAGKADAAAATPLPETPVAETAPPEEAPSEEPAPEPAEPAASCRLLTSALFRWLRPSQNRPG